MDGENLKYQIGANIAAYRKRIGLTQAGLAEKLNYSDKAVSKWERGESVPDVVTLVQLAEQFGVTVNDLLVDPNALPDNPGTLEKAIVHVSERALKRKADKGIILRLCTTLVWFVALLVFVVVSSLGIPREDTTTKISSATNHTRVVHSRRMMPLSALRFRAFSDT